MNLNEFMNYRKKCIVCDSATVVNLTGTLQEEIGDYSAVCVFHYMLPVVRKEFVTFALSEIGILNLDDRMDYDSLHKSKYRTFLIKKDGYAGFDEKFNFRMKMGFRVSCGNGHYSYESRIIKISDKSPDITKGYPVVAETLAHGKYKVVSSPTENKTSVYNFDASKEPVIIPYMEITSLPTDDPEKFVKKVQNILLLA